MDEKPMPQKALAWVSGPGRQRFHAAGLSGMGRILGARADGRTVRP